MASSDIDLIEMTDSAVARSDGDVFELDVHVVFGYWGLKTSVARLRKTVEIFGDDVGRDTVKGNGRHLRSISRGRLVRM